MESNPTIPRQADMATNYNLVNIRTLLIEGFSDAELRRFCYDTPEFRAVYDGLAANTGKAEIIDHLLEFADRRGLIAPLLTWAKAQNPTQYANHQPYELPTPLRLALVAALSPSSSPPSPPASSSPPRPLRVFLCHASADKPAVRDLYQRLNQENFIQPWLDEEDLLPGQDWDTEIRKAVRASDVVLVCLSPHAITKAGYVQKEIKFALDIADEQPEGAIFLIPLRLEACDVPERLSKWHWANLFETKGYERLLRALQAKAEAESKAKAETGSKAKVEPAAAKKKPRSPIPPGDTYLGGVRDEEAMAFYREEFARLRAKAKDKPEAQTPAPPPDRITLTTPFPLELVRVPAGEFLMGSDPAKDKNARENEQPQHRIYVSEFYIGKYPVTNQQYTAFIKATKYQSPGHWEKGNIPAGKENHPVVRVSWEDAGAFCHWLSRESGRTCRLPTEAEWEKAARGMDGRIYPWGNQWDKSKLNSKEGGPGETTPVGQYSPGGDSPYGAADMAGNVWEWCADPYDAEEYQCRIQTDVLFGDFMTVIEDPQGPHQGFGRILRGGAFTYEALWMRCAVRDWDFRYYRDGHLGFRVVLPVK